MNAVLSALILALSLTAATAFAGDTLLFKELEGGQGFFRLHLEPARMKAEVSEDGKAVKTTMMFTKAREETTILDHEKKEFMALDKSGMQKLAGTVGGAVEQMKAAMSKLPPEMQKMMKEKMGAMGAEQKSREPVTVKKVKSEKVGKWSATQYEISRGKSVLSQVWTAPFKDVGVDKANYEVVRAMSDTYAAVAKDLGNIFGAAGGAQAAQIDVVKKIEGFPVKTVAKRPNGKVDRAYQLESAEKKELSDSDFSVPEGYKKKTLGMM